LKKNALTISSPDFSPARILCIRLARLGDVILLVPALKALRRRFPQAHIAVLCGHRCAPILSLCRDVDDIIAIDRLKWRDGNKVEAARDIAHLVRRLHKAGFDLVIDFHSFRETNLLTWITGARWRIGLKRAHGAYLSSCFSLPPVLEDKRLHVSRQFLSLLAPFGIPQNWVDPLLSLEEGQKQWGHFYLNSLGVDLNSPIVGLYVGAGSPGRVWPAPRVAALAQAVIDRHFGSILLFSGPGNEELAQHISDLTSRANCRIIRRLSLPELAATIAQCQLLVSNDTGPMHLGPAVGTPTLGLFSLGLPEHYRPLGDSSQYLHKMPIENLELAEVFLQVEKMLKNPGIGH
jgi:heptosyltransferase-1